METVSALSDSQKLLFRQIERTLTFNGERHTIDTVHLCRKVTSLARCNKTVVAESIKDSAV